MNTRPTPQGDTDARISMTTISRVSILRLSGLGEPVGEIIAIAPIV